MSKPVVEVKVRAVAATSGGCAVFLGNEDKVFVMFVDQSVGTAIAMFIQGAQKERPLTHDLLANILRALGAKIERVIVNDLKRTTYFARLVLSAENESQQKKIIEIDARPSDCIAMAIQQRAPIYVSLDVWNQVKSRSFRSRANWFLCWIFGMIHQNCRWELPLRHQDACAIGTMLSAGIGGRMPGAFLACLPWLLPDNPQKVFIEVPSAFGAGSKIGCFGPASFCVFGEKRRPGKGRFLAAQATLQDEKTGVK
jgi:uncharacterized protein